MPYIKQEERIFNITALPENAGELNYAFTFIIREYLKSQPLKYQTLNDIVGALEGAKVEFQRRVVAPYEDLKIKENGDVY